jgi:hypothetical protein
LVKKPRKVRFVMSKAKKQVEEKVMLLGLTTGEQVMGKVSEDIFDGNSVVVKNPAVLVAVEKGMGMAPWLLYTVAEKEGVNINAKNVVWATEPRPEIVNQYNAQYGNGLIVPSNKIETPSPELTLAT